MSVINKGIGYGWLASLDANGEVVAWRRIIGFCSGCGRSLVSGASEHDGPSGNKDWMEADRREWERILRVRFEIWKRY